MTEPEGPATDDPIIGFKRQFGARFAGGRPKDIQVFLHPRTPLPPEVCRDVVILAKLLLAVLHQRAAMHRGDFAAQRQAEAAIARLQRDTRGLPAPFSYRSLELVVIEMVLNDYLLGDFAATQALQVFLEEQAGRQATRAHDGD